MRSLRLNLLGGFELCDAAGKPIVLSLRKARALLAVLAIQAGRPWARERLVDLLWSDRAEAQARNSLRQTLTVLRQALAGLDAESFVIDRETVTLRPEAMEIDVLRFEQLLVDGSTEALRSGLRLYRGPLLDGLSIRDRAFDDWLRPARAAYHERAVKAFETLICRLKDKGEHDRAIEAGRRLVAVEPLSEGAHRTLIQLYARQGSLSAALRQFEECRQLLRRELGIEPDDETERLVRSLREAHCSQVTETPLHSDDRPAATERPSDDLDARLPGASRDATPLPVVPSRDASDREHVPERRQVTVLSCGLVGLSPELDPEDMHEALTVLRETGVHSMADTAATIRQTTTGMLAVFGYPRASGEDAERAVRAALGIVAAARDRHLPDGSPLRVRCGIATGPVVVGGGNGRSSGAAREEIVGGVLRRADELQSKAEPGSVLISDATHDLIGALFDCSPLGARSEEAVGERAGAYRVIGHGSTESRFAALRASKAMTPLVGRRHELTLLHDCWEAARDGEGQVVLISGEPGIGKSRLVEELWTRLRATPTTRIRFDCSPHHTSSALHPVLARLERACGIRADDPPAAKLEKLEAAFGDLDGLTADALALLAEQLGLGLPAGASALDLSPRQKKARTLEILIDLVVDYAGRGPVLLVVEDVHWADPSTLEYLDALIHRIPDLPVLVVMTFRPELVAPWSGYPHATTLSLRRLTGRQVVQLAGLAAGGRVVSEEMAASIRERSNGIPLFVEELTKALIDHATGRTGGASAIRQGIPPSIQDLLLARLDRASATKEIAQIAACIGREFEHELLGAVADMPEQRLREAIEQLVAGDLIFRRHGGASATYVFRHVLIRDAAYDSLLKSDRQQVHARIMDALPRHAGNTPAEILAQHAAAAGEVETAVALWRQAARSAMARSTNAEAVAHLMSALALIEPQALQGNEALCAALHLELAAALTAAKGFGTEEVHKAYARAEELFRGRDPQRRFVALRGLWNGHVVRGELDLAMPLADEIIRLARQSGRRVEMLVACRVGAMSCYQRGDLAAAKQHADRGSERWDPKRASEHFATYGDDPGLHCTTYGALIDDAMGYRDAALRKASRALDGARATPGHYSFTRTLAHVSMLHQRRRDPPAVLRITEECIRLCDAHGIVQWRALAAVMRGWARVYLGEAEDGIDEMTRGIDAWRSIPMRFALPYFLTLLAEALHEVGRTVEARDAVGEAARVMATSGYHIFAPEIERVRARLLLAAGERCTAERALLGALRVARKQGARTHELRAATALARLWDTVGNCAHGRDLLRRSLEGFAEGADTLDLIQARNVLESLARDGIPEWA